MKILPVEQRATQLVLDMFSQLIYDRVYLNNILLPVLHRDLIGSAFPLLAYCNFF
ncbi:hypothetical protein NC651_014959 [Populus alba x Populus x berolinensis]|nr:hypothetical protein NC651_014959 [Populus alba x Populus x berolinensis]